MFCPEREPGLMILAFQFVAQFPAEFFWQWLHGELFRECLERGTHVCELPAVAPATATEGQVKLQSNAGWQWQLPVLGFRQPSCGFGAGLGEQTHDSAMDWKGF